MDETDIKRIELLTLDVKPGQVLLARVSRYAPIEARQETKRQLESALPGVTVLIVSETVDFAVIDRSAIPGA